MHTKSKHYFTLCFLLLISAHLYGQSHGRICSTPSTANPFFSTEPALQTEAPNALTVVPIALHIFTDSAGTGNGVSQAIIQGSLDSINVYFTQVNLYAVLCVTNIIPNNDAVNAAFDLDQTLIDSFMTPGMINVFMPNTVNGITWGGSSSTIGGPYTNMDYLLIMGQEFYYGILAHEIGHFLGLYHTFESSFGDELVDGSNCQTAGDLICDTPADHGMLQTHVDSVTCLWLYPGTVFDTNNDPYAPSTSNFMSYSALQCLADFTPLQLQVIRNTFDANIAFFDSSCALPVQVSPGWQTASVTVFPNPSQGKVRLELPKDMVNATAVVRMRLLGLDGMQQELQLLQDGAGQVSLDLQRLPRGVYFLEFPDDPERARVKLLLQ